MTADGTVLSLRDYGRSARISEALRRYTRDTQLRVRERGLTPQRFLMLLPIKGAPDGRERAGAADLVERMALSPTTVHEFLHRTEEEGLVARDGQEYRLTEDGERVVAQAVAATLQAERQLVADLCSLAE